MKRQRRAVFQAAAHLHRLHLEVFRNLTRNRPSVSEQVVGASVGLDVGEIDGATLVVGANDGLDEGASDGTKLVVGALVEGPSLLTVMVSDSSLT